jgi:hypothetical protein
MVRAHSGNTAKGTRAPLMAPNSTIPRVAKRVRLLLRAAQRSDGNTEKHEAEHEGYDQRDERHHGPTDVQSEREDADSEDHGELGDAHPDAGQRFAQHDLQRRGGARPEPIPCRPAPLGEERERDHRHEPEEILDGTISVLYGVMAVDDEDDAAEAPGSPPVRRADTCDGAVEAVRCDVYSLGR